MESSTGNMAELNQYNKGNPDNRNKIVWSASHLLTLGVVTRFFRNFTRYNREDLNKPAKETLLKICYQLEQKIYAYDTLIQSTSEHGSVVRTTSTTVLQQKIYHLLEHLHHQLLFYDAEEILEIIPLIDRQLSIWKFKENETVISESTLVRSAEDLARIEVGIQDKLN